MGALYSAPTCELVKDLDGAGQVRELWMRGGASEAEGEGVGRRGGGREGGGAGGIADFFGTNVFGTKKPPLSFFMLRLSFFFFFLALAFFLSKGVHTGRGCVPPARRHEQPAQAESQEE